MGFRIYSEHLAFLYIAGSAKEFNAMQQTRTVLVVSSTVQPRQVASKRFFCPRFVFRIAKEVSTLVAIVDQAAQLKHQVYKWWYT